MILAGGCVGILHNIGILKTWLEKMRKVKISTESISVLSPTISANVTTNVDADPYVA
jgi:hypothetical protein